MKIKYVVIGNGKRTHIVDPYGEHTLCNMGAELFGKRKVRFKDFLGVRWPLCQKCNKKYKELEESHAPIDS